MSASLVVAMLGACSREPAAPRPESGASTADAPATSSAPPGPASGAAAAKDYATYVVDGKTISITKQEYDKLYAKLDLFYRVFILTEEMEDRHLWLYLLQLEEAKLAGMVATDREVRSRLTYLLGGEFDEKAYEEILEFNNIPRAEFEEMVRGEVMGLKLVEYYRDTARSLDTDVIKRFVDREMRYTVTCVAFPYTDYLEGPDLPVPEASEDELNERLANVVALLADAQPDDPVAERLREDQANLEAELRKIEAVKARENAAFKRSKKAADEVKKEIIDATYAAHQSIFEEFNKQTPERIEAGMKELQSRMPDGETLDPSYREKVEMRVAQELKLEAQHATKPFQAKFFEDVVKKRNLPTFDLIDYQVDWQTLDRRIPRNRQLGSKPEQADYEKFILLNTTIPRLLVGQLGGTFPDEIAYAHYLFVMREIKAPDPKTIDPLRYRIHRKYHETVRRNQMEAMFSHVPLMTRHKLLIDNAAAPARRLAPMSPRARPGASKADETKPADADKNEETPK